MHALGRYDPKRVARSNKKPGVAGGPDSYGICGNADHEEVPMRWLAAILTLGCLAGVAQAQSPVPSEDEFKRDSRRAAPRDAFPVLDSPRMVGVPRANRSLKDSEPVIGIDLGGEQKAYPVAVMGRHELANDTCGKFPIAVSW